MLSCYRYGQWIDSMPFLYSLFVFEFFITFWHIVFKAYPVLFQFQPWNHPFLLLMMEKIFRKQSLREKCAHCYRVLVSSPFHCTEEVINMQTPLHLPIYQYLCLCLKNNIHSFILVLIQLLNLFQFHICNFLGISEKICFPISLIYWERVETSYAHFTSVFSSLIHAYLPKYLHFHTLSFSRVLWGANSQVSLFPQPSPRP